METKSIFYFDYLVYTDGGYSIQRKEGAGAYVIVDPNSDTIVTQGTIKVQNETNNRAEIKGIIEAMKALPPGVKVKVLTDSQYSIGVLDKYSSWKPSKNFDLIGEFKAIEKKKQLDVKWEWVKGHSGNRYNEMCDRLCNEAVGYDLNAEFEKYKVWKEKKKKVLRTEGYVTCCEDGQYQLFVGVVPSYNKGNDIWRYCPARDASVDYGVYLGEDAFPEVTKDTSPALVNITIELT